VILVLRRLDQSGLTFYSLSLYSYGLGDLCSISGSVRFLFTATRLTLGPTQPPIQWVPGTVSPGVKLQRHEADHSPPSSAKVKKDGAISIPHMSSWCT
jgi:hypothetical protein